MKTISVFRQIFMQDDKTSISYKIIGEEKLGVNEFAMKVKE